MVELLLRFLGFVDDEVPGLAQFQVEDVLGAERSGAVAERQEGLEHGQDGGHPDQDGGLEDAPRPRLGQQQPRQIVGVLDDGGRQQQLERQRRQVVVKEQRVFHEKVRHEVERVAQQQHLPKPQEQDTT